MENPEKMTMSLLAFYWPYGVDVLATQHDGTERRGRLVRMSLGEDEVHIRRDWARSHGTTTVRLDSCRLVLREFKDLLTPLPGGEIPAVELAKIYFGARLPGAYTLTTNFYEAEPAGADGKACPAQFRVRFRDEAVGPEQPQNQGLDFYIRADWSWHGGPGAWENPFSRINLITYLWWRHFAFQMRPEWYVPFQEPAPSPGSYPVGTCQLAGCACACHARD